MPTGLPPSVGRQETPAFSGFKKKPQTNRSTGYFFSASGEHEAPLRVCFANEVPHTSNGRRSSRIVIFANMFIAAETVIPTELQKASNFFFVSSSILTQTTAILISLFRACTTNLVYKQVLVNKFNACKLQKSSRNYNKIN